MSMSMSTRAVFHFHRPYIQLTDRQAGVCCAFCVLCVYGSCVVLGSKIHTCIHTYRVSGIPGTRCLKLHVSFGFFVPLWFQLFTHHIIRIPKKKEKKKKERQMWNGTHVNIKLKASEKD